MIYSVGSLVLLNMDLVEVEDVDVDVDEVEVGSGNRTWLRILAAAGSSWQLAAWRRLCLSCLWHTLQSAVFSLQSVEVPAQARPFSTVLSWFCHRQRNTTASAPCFYFPIFAFLFCFFGVPHASCRASATKSRPCLGRQLPCPCQRGFCRCQRGRYPAEFSRKRYILSEANKFNLNEGRRHTDIVSG